MTITQQEFDHLIKKLERFSQRHPQYYRLRVRLFALLGYFYLLGVILVLLMLIIFAIWVMFSGQRLSSRAIKLVFFSGVLVVLILRSLFVEFPQPEGIELNREQSPKLFDLLDELTDKLDTPRFHYVLLNDKFNAGVAQVPLLGILGYPIYYIIIGLPLLEALSVDEFKAVLGHELGHHSGNHASLGNWIYRHRLTWMQLYENFQRTGSSKPFRHFLDWYWPSLNAYSFVLARSNEYEADRCGAELAGIDQMAYALINTEIKAQFLEEFFWPNINQQVKTQPDPPSNIYALMLKTLQQPIPKSQYLKYLEQALARKTDNIDTHPCMSDRLNALSYSCEQAKSLVLSDSVNATAAESLLGHLLPDLSEQLSREWKDISSTFWRHRYVYLQDIKTKLGSIQERAQLLPLNSQQLWNQAYYTLELDGEQAALPLLQEVLTVQSDHPDANFTTGVILLKQHNQKGINFIEKAMDNSMDYVEKGLPLIIKFLYQQNQEKALYDYQEKVHYYQDLLQKAQEERVNFTTSDQFTPHKFNRSELIEFQEQLSNYPAIKKAYLVEKVVTYFPNEPFCLLGIVRKKSLFEEKDADETLLDLLVNNLQFPANYYYYILILNRRSYQRLKNKISQVDCSLIFEQNR